jgi:predicted negative regulator of RcsB-dependent stress response
MLAGEWISQPPVIVTSWSEALTFLSVFALLASVVTSAWRYWKVTECHVARCRRHQWKTVPGTNHVVCKKHSPQDEPSHAQVLEDHKAARAAAARKL